jgi:hypothetical protein
MQRARVLLRLAERIREEDELEMPFGGVKRRLSDARSAVPPISRVARRVDRAIADADSHALSRQPVEQLRR